MSLTFNSNVTNNIKIQTFLFQLKHLLVWDVDHLLSVPVALNIENCEQFHKKVVFVEKKDFGGG